MQNAFDDIPDLTPERLEEIRAWCEQLGSGREITYLRQLLRYVTDRQPLHQEVVPLDAIEFPEASA
jgi:hypothetical protein